MSVKRYIEVRGEILSIEGWSRVLGISESALRNRAARSGRPLEVEIEEALPKPTGGQSSAEVCGVFGTTTSWAAFFNITRSTLENIAAEGSGDERLLNVVNGLRKRYILDRNGAGLDDLLPLFRVNGISATAKAWAEFLGFSEGAFANFVAKMGGDVVRAIEEIRDGADAQKVSRKWSMRTLSEADVSEIRARRTRGDTISELAEAFAVNPSTIQKVLIERPWRKRQKNTSTAAAQPSQPAGDKPDGD